MHFVSISYAETFYSRTKSQIEYTIIDCQSTQVLRRVIDDEDASIVLHKFVFCFLSSEQYY